METDSPIFVTGPPRSGTTFMQCCLSEHPRIAIGGQEPKAVAWGEWAATMKQGIAFAAKSNREFVYSAPHYAGVAFDPQRFLLLVRDYMVGTPRTPRWGWRSLTQCRVEAVVPMLLDLWPDTRWVVCLRDPLTTMASIRNTFGPEAEEEEMARWWVDAARFGATHPAAILVLVDRLRTPQQREGTIRSVLEFLGEDYCDAVDRFVAEWPVIHRVVPESERFDAVDEAKTRDLMDTFPELAFWAERLGYALDCRRFLQSSR